jgi:hypothetical protein
MKNLEKKTKRLTISTAAAAVEPVDSDDSTDSDDSSDSSDSDSSDSDSESDTAQPDSPIHSITIKPEVKVKTLREDLADLLEQQRIQALRDAVSDQKAILLSDEYNDMPPLEEEE